MTDRTIGIGVDGNRVTVVDVVGDVAVASTTVALGTLAESLDAALAGVKVRRNGAPVRVAFVAAGVALRRIDVTAAVASSRAAFADAAFAALPVRRESAAFAGAVYDVDTLVGDTVGPGVALVAPDDVVNAVYAALGRRPAEVVASPMVVDAVDGVWLGVHDTVSDLTLVVDGRPVVYRQLRAGGLDAVASVLGGRDDHELGRRRVDGVVTGTADDELARIEVARFMRLVADEVGRTLEYWRRSGEPVPASRDLVVYGSGGGSALCAAALVDAGFAVDPPEQLVRRLAYVPVSARSGALLAYAAAVTVGERMPQVSFVDPRIAVFDEARRRTRSRIVTVAASVAVAAVIGLTVVVPLWNGWRESRAASAELTAARTAFDAKAAVYYQTVDLSLREQVAASTGAVPGWADAYRDVFALLPAGAVVSQASATPDAATSSLLFAVTVDVPGGTYADLVALLDRFAATPGVSDAWSTGFSASENGVILSVSARLTVPADGEGK